jgi:hypothetical protein
VKLLLSVELDNGQVDIHILTSDEMAFMIPDEEMDGSLFIDARLVAPSRSVLCN